MTREIREYAKSRIEYLLKICRLDERDKEALEAAIQALSQECVEPTQKHVENALDMRCDNAISRDAVQKEINCWIGSGEYRYAMSERFLSDRINNLPSVTQKSGKWIPVSERLPEDGTYLVTVERMCGTPSVNIRSFAKNLYSVDEYDFHNKKGKSGWYDYDSEYGYWEDEKVTAWLPLPKPYEPQESEE